MATMRVKVPFDAFDRTFTGGETFASGEVAGWPTGVLERRITEGFVELVSIEDAPPPAPKEPSRKAK